MDILFSMERKLLSTNIQQLQAQKRSRLKFWLFVVKCGWVHYVRLIQLWSVLDKWNRGTLNKETEE